MENMVLKKPRLEWLDALRGFTMILVVSHHVWGFGFGLMPKVSSSMRFLIMFRMPLFFFVSGFLAYRATQVWDLKNLGSLLVKKFRVQIIPTIVFFLFGIAILGKEFWPTVIDWIGRPLKGNFVVFMNAGNVFADAGVLSLVCQHLPTHQVVFKDDVVPQQ